MKLLALSSCVEQSLVSELKEMMLVISYLLIFGLISCTIGKQGDNSQNDIEGILRTLAQQKGDFGIKFHSQDNHKNQHKSVTSHAEFDNLQNNDRHDNEEYHVANLLQSIYNLQTKPKEPLSNINLLVPVRTTLRDCTTASRCKDTKHLLERSQLKDHVNNVLDFLSELDKNFGKEDQNTAVNTAVQGADRNSNDNQNHQKQRMPKIIQLSENSDAVMIDTDTFERLASYLNSNNRNEKGGKLSNVDVGRLHKGNNNNKNYNRDSVVYVEKAKDDNPLIQKLQKLF